MNKTDKIYTFTQDRCCLKDSNLEFTMHICNLIGSYRLKTAVKLEVYNLKNLS